MPVRPTMTTKDGRWSVEVTNNRTGQHFRVRRLDGVMPAGSGWSPSGKVCTSIAEVREVIGAEAFATLSEDRSKRFDGGR